MFTVKKNPEKKKKIRKSKYGEPKENFLPYIPQAGRTSAQCPPSGCA